MSLAQNLPWGVGHPTVDGSSLSFFPLLLAYGRALQSTVWAPSSSRLCWLFHDLLIEYPGLLWSDVLGCDLGCRRRQRGPGQLFDQKLSLILETLRDMPFRTVGSPL